MDLGGFSVAATTPFQSNTFQAPRFEAGSQATTHKGNGNRSLPDALSLDLSGQDWGAARGYAVGHPHLHGMQFHALGPGTGHRL